MEGPTPVSALIHAATMVAAGVYLIARVQFLFVETSVRAAVLAIGLVTALMASLIAVFQRDIKRVLAFSTISQLGYMMAALGSGAFAYGVYHLYTHAFFKALLFLAAGSVFHAVHSLDIEDAGGLLKKLKWTGFLFLIGALNLAGFPPTGGFFSKDSILTGVKEAGFHWAYYLLLVGSFLTSFYIFKVFFRVFLGAPGKNFDEAHESPSVMLVPMVVLALLSFGAIYLSFNTPFSEAVRGHFNYQEALPSLFASLFGIFLAYLAYGLRLFELEVRAPSLLYELFYNRLFIDELYETLIAGGYVFLAKMASWVDRYLIDGIVNGTAWVSVKLGQMVKRLENGVVQLYLFYTVIFVCLLLLWVYWFGGKF
jgi:NADH-quinone oxidoreductase subunit L